MKKFFALVLYITLCLFLLPIGFIHLLGVDTGTALKQEVSHKVNDFIEEETLIGILAREIPSTYESEAIKAGAVVIRSYMARRILGIEKRGAIKGYSLEELKRLWPEETFDEKYQIYQKAVQETINEVILYDNKPIEALYHQASSGRTRDAAEVYHKEIPYLKGVESKGDQIRSQVRKTNKEVIMKIKKQYPLLVADEKHLPLQIVSKDEAGYVEVVQVYNVTLTGEEMCDLFELPSTAFRIYNQGDSILFDVRGIGSGIGLSLNGANELAKKGMLYSDIIKHYYQGTTLEKYEVQ